MPDELDPENGLNINPAKILDFDRENPASIMFLAANFSRLCEPNPSDVATVYEIVKDHLKKGPKVTTKDPYKHIAQHISETLPAVMQDSRMAPVIDRLNSEYEKIPVPVAGPLVGVAIGVGIAIGLAAAGYIVYCFTEPHPEPGHSVEARCN